MCGRYFRTGDKQAIAEYFHAEPVDDAPAFPPEYNIPPTTTQPVIRQGRDTGRPELVGMRWGLVGFGTEGPNPKRATFNARAEGLLQSGLWRRPLHKHRCLIPLSGFYEWRKSDRKPFRFTMEHAPFYAVAGLWDAWKSPQGTWLQSMSVITVAANPTMQPYHDRMPAILHPSEYAEWLDRDETERPPVHLLRPFDGTGFVIHAAHPNVGNVRNQGIELLNSQ